MVEVFLNRVEQAPQYRPLLFLQEDGTTESTPLGQLHEEALHYARSLRARGVARGDLVILVFPHSGDLITAFLATLYLGALPAIAPYFNPQAPLDVYQGQVQKLVASVGARAVATSAALERTLIPFLAETGCEVVGLAGEQTPADPAPLHPYLAAGHETAYVQFSSGTTSLPKGVMLSHEAVLEYLRTSCDTFAYTEDDVTVGWLPLYHDMGLVTQVLTPLLSGVPSVLISPFHWMRRPEALLSAIDRFRGTISWMPNFAFSYCVRRTQRRDLTGLDLSSWRILGCGSEPIQAESLHRFADRFAPFGFRRSALLAGYGMAENVAGITFSPLDREPDVEWVSVPALQQQRAVPATRGGGDTVALVGCGYPKPGITLRITDEAGQPVPERQVGEVFVQSPCLFEGYLRQPDVTEAAFHGDWFRTGDLGYLAEGQLFLCGRKKDLIIVGGSNVHPEHIEAAARAALGAQAGRLVAFGVPDERAGTERPVLVCEAAQRLPDAERDALAQRVRQRAFDELTIALGEVCFVDKGWIAKTTSGKLARAASRQKYLGLREDRDVSRSEGPLDTAPAGSPQVLERQLQTLFETQLGVHPIDPSDNLFTVGGDSIQIMSALAEIEARTGRDVPLEAWMQDPTIAHLVTLLRQQSLIDPASPDGPASPGDALPAHPPRHLKEFARRVIVACLPYPVGARLVARFFGQPMVQRLLFRDEVRFLRQFYQLIEQPLVDEAAFIHQALTFRRGRLWRIAGRVRATPEDMNRWGEVVGWPRFQRAYEQGRGVVLVHAHTLSLSFARRVLERLMPSDLRALVSVAVAEGDLTDVEREAALQQRYVEQLYTCQKTLERGGIVSIAGDDRYGASRGVTVPFHGRQRAFKTGFAHLAVATGAPVLPVFSSSDLTGRTTIEFGEPLAYADQAPDEQVDALVRAYAAYLKEKWRGGAANVPPAKMRYHQALPPSAAP
ncbi:MAG: AMP-binding protein [Rhodothermales bacterium]